MTNGAQGPRVLVVATKCPWPPTDGGRLVMAETLRALADGGARITLVSPPPVEESTTSTDGIERIHIPRRELSWPATVLRAARPATIVRQDNPRAREAIQRLTLERAFDVAHAEQLQALPMLEPARQRGIPIVLRAQNVESDLWAGAARILPLAAPWLLLQAALLRRWEGRAVGRTATITAALTTADAARLRTLASGRGKVVHLAAPFPPSLPAGEPLPGTPAIVVAGGGWIPNRNGARWFVRDVWPLVLARLPAAQLHLFGAGEDRLPRAVTAHPAPRDSKDLFPANAIHVVPLRIASGVRMKILEAWARGVPVVATGAAATGLENGSGPALLHQDAPVELALAIENLAHDPDLRDGMVAEARRILAEWHDPARIAARWLEIYREAGDPPLAGAATRHAR